MPDWICIAWAITLVVSFALGTWFGLRVRVQVHNATNNGTPISTEKPQQKKRNVRIPA